uniref:Uncharacterized protein n=1 Tax=Ditylum brightwellii TaxID=49249 RepID=A0A7S1Z705_9STRA|mmetsp:Transcript_25441/g.37872  ORF Transcript_25441/g.37872 Transcript_25441/m.37872 type:complete len:128 (+) Transcript_25441:339-722(+)
MRRQICDRRRKRYHGSIGGYDESNCFTSSCEFTKYSLVILWLEHECMSLHDIFFKKFHRKNLSVHTPPCYFQTIFFPMRKKINSIQPYHIYFAQGKNILPMQESPFLMIAPQSHALTLCQRHIVLSI